MLAIQNIGPQEIEASIDGCVNARRDYILGLWAGKQLGLHDDELLLYARDIIQTDQKTPGVVPMIDKVASDLSKKGIGLDSSHIWSVFQNAERTARIEMSSTD